MKKFYSNFTICLLLVSIIFSNAYAYGSNGLLESTNLHNEISLNVSNSRITTTVNNQTFGTNVKTPTKEEIIQRSKLVDVSKDFPFEYSTEPSTVAPYSAGELSSPCQQNAIDIFNLIRFIAGIDDNVVLDNYYVKLAQAATVVNSVNNQLSHHPNKPANMNQGLFDMGYKGASSSNLGAGYFNFKNAIIHGWMADEDDSNIDRVGHRRWVLNPSMKKTGFGATGYYTAMYSFDRSNPSTTYTGVAWPAQNMPLEFFRNDYPWSFSVGRNLNASNIKVTLTRISDNTSWNFSRNNSDGYFNVNNDGYGQNGCIIFRPNNLVYNDGDVFKVQISGDVQAEYQVEFFNVHYEQDNKMNSATNAQNQLNQIQEEKAREDKAREDKAREDKAREDKAREDKAREDQAREEQAKKEKQNELTQAKLMESVNKASNWAQAEVSEAILNNLVTEEVTKNYQSNITRAEFCSLVMKLHSELGGRLPEKTPINKFTDTNSIDVINANALGIVNGVSSTSFAPNDYITREQLATMIKRALDVTFDTREIIIAYDILTSEKNDSTSKQPGNSSNAARIQTDFNKFQDTKKISSWASESFEYLYKMSVLKGFSKTELAPLSNTTREQAILISNRVFKAVLLARTYSFK